jgi:hypothetical protein
MMPEVVVEGVGAVGLAVPPVAFSYQLSVLPGSPVATIGPATDPWQSSVSETIGGAGVWFTTTTAVTGAEQPFKMAVTV